VDGGDERLSFGLGKPTSVTVPASFGLAMLLAFNAVMLMTGGSTINSTLASVAKLSARDCRNDTLDPAPRHLATGRIAMIVVAVVGNLLLLSIYLGDPVGPAIIMTVAGGAVFGLVEGTVLVSFGSSLGATLALLASRYLFRGWVERHFRKRLEQVNRGLTRDGWLYLLSLRLVPAIPFFVVDLLFGVTAFPVLRFYGVSQAAMLPATLVYVNAGTQLEHLTSLSGILSPGVFVSLVLLACLPLAARGLIKLMVKRR